MDASRRRFLAGCTAAVTAATAGCVGGGGELSAEATIDETYDAADLDSVSVEATNGRVTVRGEDRDDVRVRGHKRAASEDGLDEVSLASSREGGDLSLSVDVVDGPLLIRFGPAPTMDLELAVPADLAAAAAESTNGDVEVTGVEGDVRAETTNGKIDVAEVRGRATVDSTNGDVDVGFAALEDDVTVDTTNGDVTVRIPTAADAAVALDSVNGSLSVTGFGEGSVETDGSELETTLGEGTHRIECSTTNGDVEVVGE